MKRSALVEVDKTPEHGKEELGLPSPRTTSPSPRTASPSMFFPTDIFFGYPDYNHMAEKSALPQSRSTEITVPTAPKTACKLGTGRFFHQTYGLWDHLDDFRETPKCELTNTREDPVAQKDKEYHIQCYATFDC